MRSCGTRKRPIKPATKSADRAPEITGRNKKANGKKLADSAAAGSARDKRHPESQPWRRRTPLSPSRICIKIIHSVLLLLPSVCVFERSPRRFTAPGKNLQRQYKDIKNQGGKRPLASAKKNAKSNIKLRLGPYGICLRCAREKRNK